MTNHTPTTSRRNVLSGAGFFAGLAVAAPAVASATGNASDAAWREALTTLERAEAALEAVSTHRAKAGMAAADEAPPPDALAHWALNQETGRRYRTHYWSEQGIIDRDRFTADRFFHQREDQAETERLLAALRQRSAEQNAVQERHGLAHLKVEMEGAADRVEAARDALMRTPAPNALAIAEKLKRLSAYLEVGDVHDPVDMAFTLASPEEDAGNMAVLQIYLDALRVGGAEAQAASFLEQAAAVEIPALDEDEPVPEADKDGFAPKDWLKRFRAIGGLATVDGHGHVSIPLPKITTDRGNGETLTQLTPEATALWDEVQGDVSRLRAIEWQLRRGSGPDLARSRGKAVAA